MFCLLALVTAASLASSSAASLSVSCPAACSAACSPSSTPLLLAYLTNKSFFGDTTNFDDDGTSVTAACAQPERAVVAYGIFTAALSFQSAALAFARDLPAANRTISRLSLEKIGPAGTPMCGTGRNFSYNGAAGSPGHCYLMPVVAYSSVNFDVVENEAVPFPNFQPALYPTILRGLAAVHVDDLTTTTSLSGVMFERLMPLLTAMQFDNLFAEGPKDASLESNRRSPSRYLPVADQRQRRTKAVKNEASEGTQAAQNGTTAQPPFFPGPPAGEASISRSLTLTDSLEAPFYPGPNASVSITAELPPTTEQPTTGHPSTEGPSTKQPSTHEPSTHEPSTHEPSTRVPMSVAPETEAPTPSLPATTLAPTPAQTAAPVPLFHYEAFVSSQLLLLAWANKLLELGSTWEGRVPLSTLSFAEKIFNAVNTSLAATICRSATLAEADPYLPFSVDVSLGTMNVSLDIMTQLTAIAALGSFLSFDCLSSDKSLAVLNSTIKAFGVWSGPYLVGASLTKGGPADAAATAVLLMATRRLLQETGATSTVKYLSSLVNSLMSEQSVLRTSTCVIGGGLANNARGAAFELGVPSGVCGGPLLSIEATSLVYMALEGANFFDPPVRSTTNSPAPIGPPSQSGPPAQVNAIVGVAVGVVVVIVIGALAWNKFHRPRDDLLNQAPTENLGFY
jgi:hypothetical protein